MPYSPARTAFSRISQLAALRPVHEAFQWLHLHQAHILEWQSEMVAVPAPPFAEGPRSEWVLERFRTLGLTDPHIDEIGNVLGTIPGKPKRNKSCRNGRSRPAVHSSFRPH